MTNNSLLLNLVNLVRDSVDGADLPIDLVKEYALNNYDTVLTDDAATAIAKACKTMVANYSHCVENGYSDLASSLVPGETKH